MRHPDYTKGYDGTLQELAQAVGNMRYDSIGEFIQYLADDLTRQAEGDRKQGRAQLASKLEQTARELGEAKGSMDKVWKLCAPYMTDEN